LCFLSCADGLGVGSSEPDGFADAVVGQANKQKAAAAAVKRHADMVPLQRVAVRAHPDSME
jgi:hypothetical protein